MASREPRPDKCGSPLRGKPGLYCEDNKLTGKTRCRIHGGKGNDAGPSHPNYRTGAYSKAWGRFAETVEAAMDDVDLLDARRGVAGALGAMEEAGQRAEANDTPLFRERAIELYDRGEMPELGEWLRRGVKEDEAFRDVVRRSETYRMAVNDALRLKLHASTAMSLQDLVLALDGYTQIVLEVCGRDAMLEVAQRYDQQKFGGKLAASGFQLGARAVEAEVASVAAPVGGGDEGGAEE